MATTAAVRRLQAVARHASAEAPALDGLGATVTLRSGRTMPLFGLGVFQMSHPFDDRPDEAGECAKATAAAIGLGYRLIDTAQGYGNEDEVGQALRQAGPAADDVFLVTKLHHTTHGRDQVHAQLRESLEKLGRSSVDLYLIHNPKGGMLLETWAAMLEAKRQGLALSVGVSNFGLEQMEALASSGLELPEVNQIELHPWLAQPELVAFCQRHQIQVMGYRQMVSASAWPWRTRHLRSAGWRWCSASRSGTARPRRRSPSSGPLNSAASPSPRQSRQVG